MLVKSFYISTRVLSSIRSRFFQILFIILTYCPIFANILYILVCLIYLLVKDLNILACRYFNTNEIVFWLQFFHENHL